MYSKKTFSDALSGIELTDNETALLLLAYKHEDGITAPQVAVELGYRHFVAANSLVGRLGKKLAKQVVEIDVENVNFQGWTFLFKGYNTSDRGFVWQMRKGLRQALDDISDDVEAPVSNSGDVAVDSGKSHLNELPEEDGPAYYEGARQQVLANKYERNKKARAVCIQHYGAICQACSFNFEQVYGNIGHGYIHVHHLKPISEIGETYQLDPISDLVPVCPNCHAMIHKEEIPYSVEYLKRLINENKKNYF